MPSCVAVRTGSEIDGIGGQRDEVGERQPVVVVAQGLAVDLRRGRARSRAAATPASSATAPGRSRGRSPGSGGRCGSARRGAQAESRERHGGAHLVVGSHVGPERVRVLGVGLVVARDKVRGPHHVEAPVSLAEVERHLVAGAEQVAHGGHALSHDAADLACHRALAEILRPGNAQGGEIGGPARWRPACVARCEPERIAVVHARPGVRTSRRVSATVRPIGPSTEIGVQPSGPHVHRHQPWRRSQADHAAVGRRDAQRAARVGAGADREHVARQRHRRAARRSSGVERRVERIAGGAPDRVARVGAGAEFGHVGLGDDDGAGLAHVRHHGAVVGSHMIAIELASRAW